jgi:hypothetical protein
VAAANAITKSGGNANANAANGTMAKSAAMAHCGGNATATAQTYKALF